MRYLSIFCVVLFPSVVLAGPFTPRPLDAVAAETFAHAVERSTIARTLVTRLESSTVIVHIVSSASLPGGIGGTTRFVTTRGDYRYLRITLSSALPLRQRSAILAHELQHAWEVARSPASTVVELRRLFEGEGHRAGEYYETPAAMAIERSVLVELKTGQALQAEPVVKFDH
jgi:hypothetical protein